jgi:hypothetical protein
MKKIFILLLVLASCQPLHIVLDDQTQPVETGSRAVGWQTQRAKMDFKDTTKFEKVSEFEDGAMIGNYKTGSAVTNIDSITDNGTSFFLYKGATILTAVPGGGAASWGAISGTLSNQVDLTNALGLKANLVSPIFTGTPTVPGYVPTSTTVNGHALSSNVTVSASDVSLGNVTNESKATMFTSPTFTGSPTVPGYVTTATTVNGHALSGNVSVTASDVSLGNVTNESKATMFTSPVFTGIVKNDPSDTLATKAYARSVGGGSGSMIYPGAGIPLSTGSAWGTSITNNSTNWNSAYTWTSTNGANAVTAYGWGNHASAGYVPNTRTVNSHALTGNISVTASDVSLGNVTNESKATMFTSPTFTGTVSGISPSMVSLGNVTNESKATMFSAPTFTGHPTIEGVTSTGATGTGNLVFSASPTLTGTPLAPTATIGTNTTQLATTAFVKEAGDLKLNIANGTATGTLTTAALNVGGKDLGIDSISYVDGKYALWDGVDTITPHINVVDQVDISSIAAMQVDSLTKWVTVSQLVDSLAGGSIDEGAVANQINDTIEARLAVAVAGVRLADSTSGAGHYASDHRADLIEDDLADYVVGVAASDTLDMLRNYLTELRARKLDSDTIPLFIFGAGAGLTADTALFNNGALIGSFYNSGSDTLHITELRGVLKEGTGTETIAVGVKWHTTFLSGSATALNTSDLVITSITTGTVDNSFNNNDIPPGRWVWCTLSGASKDNKPTHLNLTMTGYKRNRKY